MRKIRRQRGSRTHGWGQIGQHRHSGSRGGTGMAGMHKHKWSYTVKYAPEHFGRNAFAPPNRITTNRWVNITDLERLASDSEELDLSSMGYDKLLGSGEIHRALKVKISRASSSAINKIKAAGGSVELESASVGIPTGEKEIGKQRLTSKSKPLKAEVKGQK